MKRLIYENKVKIRSVNDTLSIENCFPRLNNPGDPNTTLDVSRLSHRGLFERFMCISMRVALSIEFQSSETQYRVLSVNDHRNLSVSGQRFDLFKKTRSQPRSFFRFLQSVTAAVSRPAVAVLQHHRSGLDRSVRVRRRCDHVLRRQCVRHPPLHDGDLAHGYEDPRGLLLTDLPQGVEAHENRAGRDNDRPSGESPIERREQVRRGHYIPALSLDWAFGDYRPLVLHVHGS